MGRRLKENSLSLVTGLLFFGTFIFGQYLSGYRVYNEEQEQHREPTVSLPAYVSTGHFLEATTENWESEFLQMGTYVLLTVWLRQKGSAESKKLDEEEPVDADPREDVRPDSPRPVHIGGVALKLYKNSLSIAFFGLFLASLALHAVSGSREYSSEQEAHGGSPVSAPEYVTTSQFWFESMQNWQSEFMSIGAIVLFTIWLRQQGSAESKPVAAPHSQTGG